MPEVNAGSVAAESSAPNIRWLNSQDVGFDADSITDQDSDVTPTPGFASTSAQNFTSSLSPAQLTRSAAGDPIPRLTTDISIHPSPTLPTQISNPNSVAPTNVSSPGGLIIRNSQAVPTTSALPEVPRKRGRPKIQKPEVYGPKRRRGRPLGTGHKQKAKELYGEGGNNASESVRRPRGRPRKQAVPSSVSVQFGKVFVAGSHSCTHLVNAPPSHLNPASLVMSETCTAAPPLPSFTASSSSNVVSTSAASTRADNSGPLPSGATRCSMVIPDEDPQRTTDDFDDDKDPV
ncbi:hypothetical protein K443DRAFT_7480 [Laccaria amethystina LaAM-08-1]|uniref:Uncharacterized protein n=1 Tax=Laccaria amethystina LaAM-08-1 TaxID=1095629 RepID=A0A0C9XGA8_9AGAR|nr:hypothetical protein K443DRAFT_7480 [Laccaria amethystina LaAM-08-1]